MSCGQGSPELFDRVWSDGFIYTFPFGQFANKEREISGIKSGNLSIDSLSTDDLKVKLYGDIALMAGRITMKGRHRGRDISGQYRCTNVLGEAAGETFAYNRLARRLHRSALSCYSFLCAQRRSFCCFSDLKS